MLYSFEKKNYGERELLGGGRKEERKGRETKTEPVDTNDQTERRQKNTFL